MDIEIEKIVRTKRKTIALQVTDDATLIVRAPLDINDSTIMKVVLDHREWIEEKKREIETRDPKFSPKEFVNGEGFLYLGRYYRLKIVDSQEEPLKFENGFYLSRDALPRAKEVFVKWYKKKWLTKKFLRESAGMRKRGILSTVKLILPMPRKGGALPLLAEI